MYMPNYSDHNHPEPYSNTVTKQKPFLYDQATRDAARLTKDKVLNSIVGEGRIRTEREFHLLLHSTLRLYV